MRKYLLSFILIIPVLAFAQDFSNPKITNPAPATGADAWDFIDLIIQILTWIVVPFITAMLIYTGYLFTTASGDPTKIKTAKGYLKGAVIAAVVVFSAKMIVGVVRTTGEDLLK